MKISYSSQFKTKCLVIEKGDKFANGDIDSIIEYARENQTLHFDGEENLFVVDFQNKDRRVGPECYTKEALVRSLLS